MGTVGLRKIALLRGVVGKGCLKADVELAKDDGEDLGGAIFIILVGSLDERKSVDVTHVGLRARSQHVKSTDLLFESFTNPPCVLLFLIGQVHWVPDFFLGYSVALNFTINRRRLARFCMCVELSHCVNLNIKAIGR